MNLNTKIGDILVLEGILTEKQLEYAMEVKKNSSSRLGEVVVQLGLANEDQITACLAKQYDIPLIDVETIESSPEALSLITSQFALTRLILPVSINEFILNCVIADPMDMNSADMLYKLVKRHVRFFMATPSKIYHAIAKAYNIQVFDKKTESAENKKRRIKIDPQFDRDALLNMYTNPDAGSEMKEVI